MAAAEDVARQVGYECRQQFWDFHNRDQRWSVIVAHRRAGKTVACIMELLTRALATSKTNARYAYIAPYREQAKTVAWGYLKQYAMSVVKDPEKDFRESELSVELINGSKVRLFGADNPNALRGMYLDGVVLDEYADMRPALWGEVIRPALSDRRGWAVFIGTPRGRNAFFKIWNDAQRDSDWFPLLLKASETGLLPDEELADARKTMSENQYEQEYECSFEAAVIGAIYAKELRTAREAGRICPVPYDPSKLVSTYWDLGRGDSTAIWFYQWIAGEKRFIDYHEDAGPTILEYLGVLKGKGYNYDTLWLPHDAQQKRIETDMSVEQIVRSNGFKVSITPNLPLETGINAARMLLQVCYFDEKRCLPGIEALNAYRWDYNDRLGETKATPVHNWASHGADAFRYAGVAAKEEKPHRMKPLKLDTRGVV
jgi:phage terminase large subunit